MPFLNSMVTDKGILSIGKEVICKKSHLDYDGYPIPMGKYTIAGLRRGSNGRYLVGVNSPSPIGAGWGNLDGQVKDGHGLWIDRDFFISAFDLNINLNMVIKDEFLFRRKNLKGMKCRTVGVLPDGKSSFVELDEHVDGCSADGLGKAGHCIIIPHEHLKAAKKSTKSKKSDGFKSDGFFEEVPNPF